MDSQSFFYTCPECETINRVSDPGKYGGRWKCGYCKNTIFHKTQKFHDGLIQQARIDLYYIYEEVEKLNKITILTGGTKKLEKKWIKVASKIGQWNDHVDFSQDQEWVERVRESYKADLIEINRQLEKIDALLDEKDWLKSLIGQNEKLRKFLSAVNKSLIAVTGLLAALGINTGLNRFFDFLGIKYLENKEEL